MLYLFVYHHPLYFISTKLFKFTTLTTTISLSHIDGMPDENPSNTGTLATYPVLMLIVLTWYILLDSMELDGASKPTPKISTHGRRSSRRAEWRASKGLAAHPKSRGMNRQGGIAAKSKAGRSHRRRWSETFALFSPICIVEIDFLDSFQDKKYSSGHDCHRSIRFGHAVVRLCQICTMEHSYLYTLCMSCNSNEFFPNSFRWHAHLWVTKTWDIYFKLIKHPFSFSRRERF